MITGLLLTAALAHGELPPPDYRSELANAAADEIRRRAEEAASSDDPFAGMRAAEEFADRWRRRIGADSGSRRLEDDAKLAYELGLGWRLAGDEDRALAALNLAIVEDPSMVAAHYDRGEIKLNRGQVDAAILEFQTVVRLKPTGWPGHFRLADIARRAGDAQAFEHELTEALRGGFSFRALAGDESWHQTFSHPRLGPVMRRLITVYQGDDVMGIFERGPGEAPPRLP